MVTKKKTFKYRWQALGSYRTPLIIVVILHLLLLSLLFVTFNTPRHTQLLAQATPQKKTMIVQAHSVSLKALQQQQARKRAALLAKKRAAERKRRQRLARIAAQKKAEAAKRAKILAAKLAAAKRAAAKIAAEKKAAQQRAAAKRLAAQKAAAQKRAAQKAAQAKAQKLAKLKAMQEKLQQQIMQQQLSQDKSSIRAARQRIVNRVVNQYTAQILSVVGSNWIIPRGTNPDVECDLNVHLGPGGVVLRVSVEKSSGDRALDRSAVTAVYRSSPLPVPKDPAMFSQFRYISLKMQPKHLVAAS